MVSKNGPYVRIDLPCQALVSFHLISGPPAFRSMMLPASTMRAASQGRGQRLQPKGAPPQLTGFRARDSLSVGSTNASVESDRGLPTDLPRPFVKRAGYGIQT